MHELSVMKEIIGTVSKYAKKYPKKRVTKIYLVIGELSSIVDDSMEYYFKLLTNKSSIKNAKLSITRTQAIAVCHTCNAKTSVSIPLSGCCPKCGKDTIRIEGGLEFYIDSIELT